MANRPSLEHIDKSHIVPTTIPLPGDDVVLVCPADLDGRAAEMFDVLAEAGRGRYSQEDLLPLACLASAEARLEHWMAEAWRLLDEGDLEAYEKAEKRAAVLVRQVMPLRAALGATPAKRFDMASRRRGAETYKMNGAPRDEMAAAWREIKALEAGGGG